MSIFYTLFVTLAGHKLVLGLGSGAPRSSGVLYIKSSSDEHILYLICDTGRTRIGVGYRGQSPRKLRGFGAINYCQISMILYLICDTGRKQIGVGSRERSPKKLRGFIH